MRFLAAATLFSMNLWAAGELSGRRVPSFTLPDLNINYHDIYDYRGKIVLLDIVQTTCPVCQTSQKIFETIRLKYPDKVTVLAIVTQPDTQVTVKQFIGNYSVKTPVLFDCGQAIAALLKLTPRNSEISMPHLFVVDAKGMIRNDWGYKQGNEPIFEKLEPLMKEVTALVGEMGGGGAAPKGPAAPAAKKK